MGLRASSRVGLRGVLAMALAVALAAFSGGGAVPGAASAARADDEAKPAQTVASEQGDVLLTLPGDWAVEKLPLTHRAKLKLRLRTGAESGGIVVWGYADESVRNARARCLYELPHHIKDYQAASHGVGHAPVEHLWTASKWPEGDVHHLFALRIVRRVALMFLFEVPSSDWERVHPLLLEAVRTADTKRIDNVERPSGYRTLERDGYLYLVHPAAKDRDALAFHSLVLAAERDWAKTRGPVPKPKDNPIEVWFHGRREDAESAVTARLGKPWSTSGVYDDCSLGVLVGAKLPQETGIPLAELRRSVWRVFHMQCFGPHPEWMMAMESWAEWMEASCGKSLPWVPAGAHEPLPDGPSPLDYLFAGSYASVSGDRPTMTAYLGLFRCGPKPYQDAWKSFLAEMRRSGDWREAEKILRALDPAKTVAAAEAFRAKSLKVVQEK